MRKLLVIGEEAVLKLTRGCATDEDLLNEARKHMAAFHHKLLEKATLTRPA